jgi:hypothetical protein
MEIVDKIWVELEVLDLMDNHLMFFKQDEFIVALLLIFMIDIRNYTFST